MSMLFEYTAIKAPENLVKDVLEAETYELAVRRIIQQGFTPLEIKEKPAVFAGKQFLRKFPIISGRIKARDIAVFTRQVSDLLESSIPIYRALQIISRQTANERLRIVTEEMAHVVHGGGAFSEALRRYPHIFSTYYVNITAAGEVGGHLEPVIARLAESLEKELETAGKVKQNLAYPALIFCLGLVTIFILISFVVPRIAIIFNDFDQALPAPTRLLMDVSGIMYHYWWLFIFVVGGTGAYVYKWLRTPKGKAWLDTRIIRAWGLGPFIKNVEISRFARTLGSLIACNVPIVTALEIAENTVGNQVFKAEVKSTRDYVEGGGTLGEAFGRASFFSEAAVNMVSVGEETSRLEKGLYKIAEIYEKESEGLIKTLISLLGPAVLTLVIMIVGAVVVAMLLPIMQMNLLIN